MAMKLACLGVCRAVANLAWLTSPNTACATIFTSDTVRPCRLILVAGASSS